MPRSPLLVLLLLPACRPDLRCGQGTHREGDWCVADVLSPDDTPVDPPDDDPPDQTDTAPPEDTESPPPEETENPGDTDQPSSLPPYFGNVMFVDAAGMQAFCDLHDGVYGNIDVRGLTFTDLMSLDCLARVNGNLSIDATGLTSVHLPNLTRVRGGLSITAPSALTISLPALVEVGGNLIINTPTRFNALVSIQLPALRRVELDVRVDDTRTLTALELPALEFVGRNLWFRRHQILDRVEAPALAWVGGALRVEDNTLLHAVSLPQVTAIGDTVTGELAIEDNAELANMDGLMGITRVSGSLVIRNNPMLPATTAEALREAIGDDNVGGIVVIEQNAP